MSEGYFDASALMKLLLDESGSALAIATWESIGAAASSRLAHPEVSAALRATRRNHDLTAEEHRSAVVTWDEIRSAIVPVELTAAVELDAGRLADVHALKGADAVHLASAVSLQRPGSTFVVWDRRLHAAAAAEGFAVVPPAFDP